MSPSGTADPRVTPAISLIAGGTAGGIESFITYPFEFAKTRAQLRNSTSNSSIPGSRNPFEIITRTIQRDGVRALYLGCSTLVIGTIAKDAVRFVSFDTIRASFADEEGKLSAGRSLAAGMAAGIVASTFAVTPTERVKTALIDDARTAVKTAQGGSGRRFNGTYDAVRVIVAEHGWKGLYRGYISTTAKQMGTTSARMGSYNILKEASRTYDLPQNSLTSFANGAVAGIITTYATQPIDTVKTRAQSARGEGLREAIAGVYKDGGVKAFWRGSTMRLGRTILAGGILFTAYEQVVGVLVPIMGRDVDIAPV